MSESNQIAEQMKIAGKLGYTILIFVGWDATSCTVSREGVEEQRRRTGVKWGATPDRYVSDMAHDIAEARRAVAERVLHKRLAEAMLYVSFTLHMLDSAANGLGEPGDIPLHRILNQQVDAGAITPEQAMIYQRQREASWIKAAAEQGASK